MKNRLSDLTPTQGCHTAPVMTSSFLEEFLPKVCASTLYPQITQVDEVQKLNNRISHSVGELKSRHHTILTEINPPKHVRVELEQFNNDIKRTADDIQGKLKDLEGSFSECENANSGSVYSRIQNTQDIEDILKNGGNQKLLVLIHFYCIDTKPMGTNSFFYQHFSKFAEIMNAYNQELLSFRESSKERIQRQLKIRGRVITEEETEDLLQNNNSSVFTLDSVSGSITGQTLNEIESRHKDILCLEASIRELNNMFIDIAMLVSRQGEMANNIEKTVMKAGNYVEQGKENVKEAVVYKNSWRIRLPTLRRSFKGKAKAVTSDGS